MGWHRVLSTKFSRYSRVIVKADATTGMLFADDPARTFVRKSIWQGFWRPSPFFARTSLMNRSPVSWKALTLTLVLGGPVGYWLFSGPTNPPSASYLQQVALAQEARSGLNSATSDSIAGAEQLSKAFRDVSKSMRPSVVSIKNVIERSSTRVRSGRGGRIPSEIEQFLGRPLDGYDGEDLSSGPVQNGLGSGVIVRNDGYILTNNHVVKGASILEVVLSDDRKFNAKVIGTDERTDLAVLKIDATGLIGASLGNSANMEVGDWVIAIGSPFGLAQTVTAGIVSATNRSDQGITPYDSFIQTDAAINPGNSGGPLLNLRGEVIGINTAIASRSGGYSGICFAIPSDTARRVLDDLISKGRVTRGVIGIRPETLTSDEAARRSLPADTKGAVVASVTKGMAAERAGLKQGDVITSVNGLPITSEAGMRRSIGETKPGTQVQVDFLRGGKPTQLSVQVDELDEAALAAASMDTAESLGIVVGSVSEETSQELGLVAGEGVEVKGVNRASPFAGRIPAGVVVLSINGKKTDTPAEFVEQIKKGRERGAIRMVLRDSESEKILEIRGQ